MVTNNSNFDFVADVKMEVEDDHPEKSNNDQEPAYHTNDAIMENENVSNF